VRLNLKEHPVAAINYTPPPTIRDFILHYRPGELFYDWIIGPVGSGKTTGIFFKLVRMAALQEKSPIDGIRRSRAVVVRNTMPQLRDTTLVSWNYWFKDGVAGQWKATEKNFILKFADVECEVLFRPLDTADDVQRVLSLEITFAVLDEFVEIDEAIVEALGARCGRYPPEVDGGATNWGMWGSSNPGNEDDWWFDYLGLSDEPIPENALLFLQPPGDSPQAENIANLPGGTKYYESLKVGKSAHWIAKFISTKWGFSLSGTPVIATFNAQLHVAHGPLKPNPNLPLVAGFDPGLSGSALIFGQQDLDGRLTVLDELIQRDMGAERIITDRLKPLLKARFSDYEFIIAPDPAADSRSNNNEKTIVDTLRDRRKGGFRVVFPDMNNRLPMRVEAIEHFTTRLVRTGAALQIDPKCKHTIRSLQGGWRYETNKKGKLLSEEPEKNQSSHAGDAFGYLCRYFQHSTAREARRSEARPTPMRIRYNPYVMR
jgi:hypothetical protein